MITLEDLSAELLEIVGSFLDPRDLKNFLSTSKTLNGALRFALFRRGIHWTFPHANDPEFITDRGIHTSYGTNYTTTSKGHKLMQVLRKTPAAAAALHFLILDYDCCLECRPFEGIVFKRSPCRRLNHELLSKLTGLRTLVLLGMYNHLLKGGRKLPPNLTKLNLTTFNPQSQGGITHFPVADVLETLRHPNLKTVLIDQTALRNMIDGTFVRFFRRRAPIDNVHHLRMFDVPMKPLLLKLFLGHFTSLKHFYFSRGCRNIDSEGEDDGRWHGFLTLNDISVALEEVQTTVQSVEICYGSCRHRWLGDNTQLTSFHDFVELKSLTIDPSMILGRTVCPAVPIESHYLELSSLASKLPVGLEKLNLVIDLEQAARTPQYAERILGGLFVDRGKLPCLRTINISGLNDSSQGLYYCCCPGPATPICFAPPAIRGLWWPVSCEESLADATFPSIAPTPGSQFFALHERFNDAGITVNYIGDHNNDEGRWRAYP
ncbi:hypothetical protein PV04_02297 [Phialophora macrospora]|uniref:F-box domain-containing protein n=1 Tax=Phialophora macrospora TaxID=1851006 RepID=A0A0D2FTY2_9EURO|nr:hypothetical protein PV04_02297 [Phialophora macrospora]